MLDDYNGAKIMISCEKCKFCHLKDAKIGENVPLLLKWNENLAFFC